ncbi:MAG: CPBP family glutamic-type intramembrane protease [Dysgonomonas sp.]|nr:CPBP family glutamic-type intramembrane protease [Dysgonomonas sp.]
MIKKEIYSFQQYLRSPYYQDKEDKIRIQSIIALIAVYFSVMIVCNILIRGYISVTNLVYTINTLPIFDNVLFFTLLIGLVGPLKEEVQFRLLLKINKPNIIIFYAVNILTAVVLFLLGKVTNGFVYISILGLISLFLWKKGIKIKNYYQKYFSIIFYLFTVVFALLHITNYGGDLEYLILGIPILVLPQFVLGCILGYVRIKFGFWYNVLFHVVNNIIAFIFLYKDVMVA